MQIRALAETVGAEVVGLDLGRRLSEQEVIDIQQAWAQYYVLTFRRQEIDDASHAQLARIFGSPAEFRADPESGSASVIYGASNVDEAGRLLAVDDERSKRLTINWFWHIDGCYKAMPNKGVVLRALQTPAHGGETVFANLEAAYATLPEVRRRRLDRLICRHSFAHMIDQTGMPAPNAEEAAGLPAAQHPLVWRHDGSRRSLFLSPPYMETVEGLRYAEAQALVEELTEWATRERFVYQHSWEPGDVLVWDNRWTMHKVLPYDLAGEKRVMRGATLLGSDPVHRVQSI